MGRLYRRRRDITHSWKELPGGSGTGTVQLRAPRIRRGAILGMAGRGGFAGRVVGLTAAMVTGRWAEGGRSDAAVRAKPLILLNGDKVTPVALPDRLI
jgi:hypothetical protein